MKAIQVGLLLSLKNEIVRVAPKGRVNAVAPGWTYSPMTRGALDPEVVERVTRTMALRWSRWSANCCALAGHP